MVLHRGKIAREPTVVEVRALTRDDLGLLAVKRPHGADGLDRVQKLRDPHHRLARLVAAGLRTATIVERSGYSYNRVATLMKDPAFIELVAKYRASVDESFREDQDAYHELLFSNMVKAERMLAEKLEDADDAGEFLPTRDLIAISRDAADRMGYGKHQTSTNVNVDFAARLESTIARSRLIEGRTVPAAPQSPQASAVPSAASSVAPQSALRRI